MDNKVLATEDSTLCNYKIRSFDSTLLQTYHYTSYIIIVYAFN